MKYRLKEDRSGDSVVVAKGDEHLTPSLRNHNGNFSNFKKEKQTYQGYSNSQPRDGEGDEHSTPPARQSANSDRTPLPNAIRTSYTQILVNPMQLQDHEFTTWLERLVEARKNRQENKARPYRNYRKPYNQENTDSNSRVAETTTTEQNEASTRTRRTPNHGHIQMPV